MSPSRHFGSGLLSPVAVAGGSLPPPGWRIRGKRGKVGERERGWREEHEKRERPLLVLVLVYRHVYLLHSKNNKISCLK